MRSNLIWKDSLKGESNKFTLNAPVIGSILPPSTFVSSTWTSPSPNTQSVTVTGITFSTDGSKIFVSSGKCIHVYNSNDGNVIQTLAGHTMTVTCVSCSRDGEFFASGSLDKSIIIWKSNNLNGLVKFSHSDAIKCVSFNPVTHHLVSVTSRDFGFWSPECKQVNKYQLSMINCVAWSTDGYNLAFGLHEGGISIRNRLGNEIHKIQLNNQLSPSGKFSSNTGFSVFSKFNPILGIAFSPRKGDTETDILAIVDQNQVLSFYDLNGKQIGKEKQIGFYCMSLEFSLNGEFLLLCGSNKAANLYTREGIFIGSIGENTTFSWILSASFNSSSSHVALGSEEGDVMVYELHFSTVHSLYHEHYAYRNSMTDVIIHNLLTEEKGIFNFQPDLVFYPFLLTFFLSLYFYFNPKAITDTM